jgi:surface antigen
MSFSRIFGIFGYCQFTMRIPALLALMLAFTPSGPAQALYEGLQCVPYARQVTGISIYGDAWTWWGQADGRYARGSKPKAGAVLAFKPHGAMRLGHVAVVRRIVDSRTLLVSHANWSTIDGMRGHVEQNVKVVDTSAANDWSEVRVYFAALGDLGTTHYPVHGFIYPQATKTGLSGNGPVQIAARRPAKQSITFAATKPKTNGSGFTLNAGLLSQIDKAAAKERKPAPR